MKDFLKIDVGAMSVKTLFIGFGAGEGNLETSKAWNGKPPNPRCIAKSMGHVMCRWTVWEGKRIFLRTKFHMAPIVTKALVMGAVFFQGRHLPVISGVACITPISTVKFHPRETKCISLFMGDYTSIGHHTEATQNRNTTLFLHTTLLITMVGAHLVGGLYSLSSYMRILTSHHFRNPSVWSIRSWWNVMSAFCCRCSHVACLERIMTLGMIPWLPCKISPISG